MRKGLVAAYDLRNTGDVQSVPNLVSGGAALQRGSAAGADTNDPTPSATGWAFTTDDYADAAVGTIAQPFTVATGIS